MPEAPFPTTRTVRQAICDAVSSDVETDVEAVLLTFAQAAKAYIAIVEMPNRQRSKVCGQIRRESR